MGWLSGDRASKRDSADEWIVQGAKHAERGQLQEAADTFGAGLRLYPNSSILWQNRGAMLGKMGRYTEALGCYERASELDPDEIRHWRNRSAMLGLLGRHHEALNTADRGLEIDPTDHALRTNRSAAHEALETADRASRPQHRGGLSPDSPEMQGMATGFLDGAMRSGNIHELRNTVRLLLGQNVSNLEMLYDLARTRHPEAPTFQEIVQLLAEDAVVQELTRTSSSAEAASEPFNPSHESKSMDDWLELLRVGSPAQQIEARSALAVEFGRRGELDHAVELLERNVWAGVRTSAIYLDLARLYSALGQHELAAHATTDARQIQSEESDTRSQATSHHAVHHQTPAAVTDDVQQTDSRVPQTKTPPASFDGAGHQSSKATSALDGSAPLWRRTLALVIDLLLMATMIGVTMIAVGIAYETSQFYRIWNSMIDVLIQVTIMIAYGTFFESSPIHATLGKALTGIRVSNRLGRSPSFGQVLGRNCVKALTGPKFLFWLLSIASVWRDEERRSWHDKAAGTLVRRMHRD